MPFALLYPLRLTETVTVNLPWHAKIQPEQFEAETPAMRFAYKVEPTGARFTVSYSFETRADHVAVADSASYLVKIDEARDHLGYEMTVPRSWTSGQRTPPQSTDEAVKNVATTTLKTASRPASSSRIVIPLAALVILALWAWNRRKRIRSSQDPALHPLHHCAVCGATEHTNPHLDFRVASDGNEYCLLHLRRGPSGNAFPPP